MVVPQERVANFILVAWEPLQVAKDVVVYECTCMVAQDLVLELNLDVKLILLA